jgi:outer membrane protein assembly factor BamB
MFVTGLCSIGPVNAVVASAIRGGGSKSAEASTAFQENAAHSGSVNFGSGFRLPLKIRWGRSFEGDTSYPVIAHRKVFIAVQNSQDFSVKLYALSLANGSTLWSQPLEGMYWAAPAYDGGNVFVSDNSGAVTAFDALNGDPLWTVQAGNSVSAPIAIGGRVFVDGTSNSGTFLSAIEASSGGVLWTVSNIVEPLDIPAGGEGGVYTCDVYKFSPVDGTQLWHYDSDCVSDWDAPVLYGGRLYIRDVDGNGNVVLNAANGIPESTFGAYPPPAFFKGSNGKSYGVTLTDAQLFCFSTDTGNVIWSFAGDGKLSSAPLVVNGNVVVGSLSGNLYVLDGRSGSKLWVSNFGSPIEGPDERNRRYPLTGFAAGEGTLVVPAGSKVFALAPK